MSAVSMASRPLVVAAVGSLAAEVEHRVDGEIGERAAQVRFSNAA